MTTFNVLESISTPTTSSAWHKIYLGLVEKNNFVQIIAEPCSFLLTCAEIGDTINDFKLVTEVLEIQLSH